MNELKEYKKAEKYIKRTLKINLRILNEGHFMLSVSYHHLTILYINWQNIKRAKHYLEKNHQICSTLSKNHPLVNLLQEDCYAFEKFEKEILLSENIEIALKSKFDVLNNKNQNSTSLLEYFHTLAIIYFEHRDYEKAIEYFLKKRTILLNSDSVDSFELILFYIYLGLCYLYKKDFRLAMQLQHQAIMLKDNAENKIDIEKIDKLLAEFTEALVDSAIQFNSSLL